MIYIQLCFIEISNPSSNKQSTTGDLQQWRSDGKCGNENPLSDGTPAECDPDGENPCCNQSGECSKNEESCSCPMCVDYRVVRKMRESGANCSITVVRASISRYLKNFCFDQNTKKPVYKCLNSNVYYEAKMTGVFGLWNASNACENDQHAYQVCGFQSASMDNFNSKNSSSNLLCGGYICPRKKDGVYRYIECADKCKDDKRDCETSQQFDGSRDHVTCNDKCDKANCKDESNCNEYRYGVSCSVDVYVPVHKICDGSKDCIEESDERGCVVTDDTVNKCRKMMEDKSVGTVPIHNYTRCAVLKEGTRYCLDYSDQTNCTDEKRIGGKCKINGFMSSVSKYVVCAELEKDKKLCDDKSEENCHISKHEDCKIHKHRMCDGVYDCSDDSDETDEICTELHELNCTRRFNLNLGDRKEGKSIPSSWIMDNETDCMDGEDEDAASWKDLLCPGEIKQLRDDLENKACQDVFKCPGSNKFVPLKKLCDGVESCGENAENDICRISRDFPDIKKIAPYNKDKKRDVCIGSKCEVQKFGRQWEQGIPFGVTETELLVPTSRVSCKNLFGDYYLFLSCMDLCLESDAVCPLETLRSENLSHNSCAGQYRDRIYTILNNKQLTFVNKTQINGIYHQEFLQCSEKNSTCIEYNQVCDTVDDCGDMSDEINCTNHMVCEDTLAKESETSLSLLNSKHQFISLRQKCDGRYDCFDLSDECNADCGKEILGNLILKINCWLMGILAMIFNAFNVFREISAMKNCVTEQMMTSKALMALIGSGDFLVGLYLTILSIYDSFIHGKGFCRKQAEWLTGTPCLALGVISTLGSQISLFTMTVLSVIRMYGLACQTMRVPGPVNRKSIVKVISLGIVIITAALVIAVTPLVPSLEDYFVQGMYYSKTYKLFIGFPNKERHVRILQAYQDRNKTEITSQIPMDISWREIGERVNRMFSHDYGNLTGSPVHFYGNDGMCLFKYFVRTNDARLSRQSESGLVQTDPVVWTMLAVNFLCFIIITSCYIVITVKTIKSSENSGQRDNPERIKEERAMQRKVMMIIATDFLCWVPFIIISALHNLTCIDASDWYDSFAMTVLPLNSVVNPLIYEKALGDFVKTKLRKAKELLGLGNSSVRPVVKNPTVIRRMSQVSDKEQEQGTDIVMNPVAQ